MLDVGQGDCTFIVGPEGDAAPVLFDCRDAYVATRFVKDHRITSLQAVVASHLDLDHIRGMLPFLKLFLAEGGKVDVLHAHIDKEPDPTLRMGAFQFLKQAVHWDEEKLIPLAGAFRGKAPERICGGAAWSVEIILPVYGALVGMRLEGGEEPNRASAVLRVSAGDHAILVGGDATLDSWERLDPALLRASLFRIPHHGGDIDEGTGTWKIADLYRRVAPKLAVISVGTNNGYEHPRRESLPLTQVAAGECRLLCTQLTGRCHDNPTALRDRSLDLHRGAAAYAYRHRVARGDGRRSRPKSEVPCAGSIVASVSPDGVEVVPAPGDWHDGFVELVDRPLCRPANV